MQYRELGTSGIQASVVAIGTWQMGGWRWGGTDEASSIQTIHAALDSGINFLDTAPAYGMGLSEEVIGKALKGKRNQVILATKCGLVWHTNKGTYHFDQQNQPIHKYLGPESIKYEVDLSLQRMKTDYIDLYQTHWQDVTTPIEDTMGALLDLQQQGKIRAIGVSNATVDNIKEYQRYGVIASSQEQYSMLERKIEKDLLPYCQSQSISMLAYAPLAKGLLTGKIGPEREFSGDDQRINHPLFTIENRTRVAAMLEQFKSVAQSHNISLGQLAIAWTFSQPGVTHVLGGTQKAEQAVENAAAGDVILTEEEIRYMNHVISDF